MNHLFHDRAEAGAILAGRLRRYAGKPGTCILALGRGGVPVAHALAQQLRLAWDVLAVRKLGRADFPGVVMGAVAPQAVRVLNPSLIAAQSVPDDIVNELCTREMEMVEREDASYRHGRPPPDLAGRTVILADDGIDTGTSLHAAVSWVRRKHAARIVAAVPTVARATFESIRSLVDEFEAIIAPEHFGRVGSWYQDFPPVDPAEVRLILAGRVNHHDGPTSGDPAAGRR